MGDQHLRGVCEAVAAWHEELERVVEAGGVRLALVRDRPELGDVRTKQRRGHARLSCRHPVEVAPERGDLAVMGDHTIGVSELPRRESVGGEALMYKRKRGGEARMVQVWVRGDELIGEEHAFVHQRAA